MNRLFRKVENVFADAALFEMDVNDAASAPDQAAPFRESLEEYFMEIAFAEAGSHDMIRRTLMREHFKGGNQAGPGECGCRDNDICFVN